MLFNKNGSFFVCVLPLPMSREEKRRKFHEAVLNMLYPLPISQQLPKDDNSALLNNFTEDDLGGTSSKASSSEDDDDGENEPGKLTRAQRKRLRKKNLKIDASRRGRIVGPLLPPTAVNDENFGLEKHSSPSVRPNASKTDEKPGGEVNTLNKSKVKQRRMAKKLGRESSVASHQNDNCKQDQ
ncbi:uncharacterized protein LOC115712967 isoform X1 [Cannabis sativa]|uniref:uncharacterized protein LOC115712967 isoform X1 n=1 Tax=Cannabis sativa TaxID=3483 RepID=UPI0029CA5BCA|nr:uncharacterized protein LOC115712967 isoform X1 [Cannabis sativa]